MHHSGPKSTTGVEYPHGPTIRIAVSGPHGLARFLAKCASFGHICFDNCACCDTEIRG